MPLEKRFSRDHTCYSWPKVAPVYITCVSEVCAQPDKTGSIRPLTEFTHLIHDEISAYRIPWQKIITEFGSIISERIFADENHRSDLNCITSMMKGKFEKQFVLVGWVQTLSPETSFSFEIIKVCTRLGLFDETEKFRCIWKGTKSFRFNGKDLILF